MKFRNKEIFQCFIGVPIVGTTLRELIHTSIKQETTAADSRSRNCPYLDTINRYEIQ